MVIICRYVICVIQELWNAHLKKCPRRLIHPKQEVCSSPPGWWDHLVSYLLSRHLAHVRSQAHDLHNECLFFHSIESRTLLSFFMAIIYRCFLTLFLPRLLTSREVKMKQEKLIFLCGVCIASMSLAKAVCKDPTDSCSNLNWGWLSLK